MSIDRKINHYSLNNPASIYNEEALTSLELSARTAGLVNECVDNFNQLESNTVTHLDQQDKDISTMINKTMPAKVDAEVQERIDNGAFDRAIDEYAGNLENRVDNLLGAVTEGTTTMDAEIIDARTDGNGYQHKNLGSAVRKPLEMYNKRFGCGANLLNVAEFTAGLYYSYSNGQPIVANDYSYSDFIPCKADTDYIMRGTAHISIWDKDHKHLRGFVSQLAGITFNTGADASYIRVSVQQSNLPSAYLMEGSELIPFKKYVNTVSNSVLDDDQFNRKKFTENLMNGDFIIPTEWEQGGLNGSGGFVNGFGGYYRTKYFSVPEYVKHFTVKGLDGIKVFVCGYDKDYNFIKSNGAWEDEAIITNNCPYYIITQNHNMLYLPYDMDDKCIVSFNLFTDGAITVDYEGVDKKEYESGYIPFTVPVNQNEPQLDVVDNSIVDSENFVEVDCILKLPTSYVPAGKPTKLLMLVHGAGRGVTGEANWTTIAGYNNMVDAFVSAGYAVFDCNGYGNDAFGRSGWGCNRAIEGYRKAYDYVVRNYNVETSVSIYGFSMGGLTAYNLVWQGFPNVKSLGLGSPVLNLKDMCWDNGVNSAFLEAYGMSETEYEEDKTIGCDPIKTITEINGKECVLGTLPPIKIWFGSIEGNNATDVKKEYGIQLCNALRNAGHRAYYKEVQGAGHEVCYGSLSSIIPEFVQWANRFNM